MNKASLKYRVWILILLLAAVVFFYIYTLMDMQIVKGADYAEQAKNSRSEVQVVQAARGEIVDRYGRPLVVNDICYDIIFEKAYMERGTENQLLLSLFALFEEQGEVWIDNLPISKTPPFAFEEGMDNGVSRLKEFLSLQPTATVDNVMEWLASRYGLEEYDPLTQRKLAGVRYEMEQRGFSINLPYTFAVDVTRDMVIRISERNYEFPGVREMQSTVRNYVSGDTAPWLIGWVGPIWQEEYQEYKEKGYKQNDIIGKDGIEKAFEEELRGTDGTTRIYLSNGSVVDVEDETLPQPGKTLSLTLDKNFQKKVQEILAQETDKLRATGLPLKGKETEGATAVVLDVKTGAILAAANYPSYSLATYQADYTELISNPLKPLFNRAFQGTYTPGSIFKPLVATAALSEELITPSSTVTCNHQYTYFTDYQPFCLGWHGSINVVNAIKESCNIFFYDVGRRLTIDKIDEYGEKFGFGQRTGVELPDSAGVLASPEEREASGRRWEGGDVLQASIGQSDTLATPLQLANYVATIANRGKRMRPFLVKSINTYSFDQTLSETQPEVVDTIDMPDEVFDTVIQGMTNMASYYFSDYPVKVAAKTGTPQTYGEYTNSTFITFAPADDPQIAMAVIVEKGGQVNVCAPIVRQIYDAYFGFDTSVTQASQDNLLLQ